MTTSATQRQTGELRSGRTVGMEHVFVGTPSVNTNFNAAHAPSVGLAAACVQPKWSGKTQTMRQQFMQRIQKELEELTLDPPPSCSAGPKGDTLLEWAATIEGPSNTVYEGGIFFMDITFTPDYPFKPPKVVFRTRIYHCNINSQGFVSLDILKDNWSSTLNISKILQSIYALLAECNPVDPLVGNIAHQYLHNREEHDKTARLWTKRYAT